MHKRINSLSLKAAGLEVDESVFDNKGFNSKSEGGGENGNEAEETGVDFIKLHVPAKTLMKYAEILKMRMPLRVRKNTRFIVKDLWVNIEKENG